MSTSTCPDSSVLQAHVEGFASDDERETVRAHLPECASCRALVLALAPEAPPDPNADTRPGDGPKGDLAAHAGQQIGRYVVLRKLGEGGMGVVYAAYDPELDRQVALKLIRRAPDEATTREVQERLLREAQAMARVAHPSVVTVHDVGRYDDQVFVAMELIDGETLAMWLGRSPRSTREVVDVFVRAGRGLQAVHAAGLVHRDFKPNNVMIDGQGRVRVMDFGLARPAGLLESTRNSPSPSRLDQSLTGSNVLMGTPAYMAPEQLALGPADARTDEFSFCVALYEALCGRRPFVAVDAGAPHSARFEARRQRPQRKVAGWLLAVVERGLEVKPDERWPSMEPLLQELAHDPRRWQVRVVAALTLVGVLAAGALAYRHELRAHEALCNGFAGRLAGVWDSSTRAAMGDAFAQTGVAYGAASFGSAAAILDRYAGDWVAERSEACRATRLRGEESEELLDLRMTCLDDCLGQLASLAALFTHADGSIVEHAVGAASALPAISQCADGKRLRERVPPPKEPIARAKVDAAKKRLAEVVALHHAGKFAVALPLAETLSRDTAALGYSPLAGEARFWLAELLHALGRDADAEREVETAALDSERGRDDEQAGRAWSTLGFLVGTETSHAEEGLRWMKLAQAEFDRSGGGEHAEEWMLHQTAPLLHMVGRDKEAVAAAERSVALDHQHPEWALPLLADLANLATIYAELGRSEEAISIEKQIVVEMEKSIGPDHPRLEPALSNLALDLHDVGHDAEALPLLDRVLALMGKLGSPEYPMLALTLTNRGRVLVALGRFAEAIADARRALAVYGKQLPPNDPTLWDPLVVVGAAELGLGHAASAVPTLTRALALVETDDAPPIDRAEPRFLLARALYQTGQKERARKLAADAESALAEAAKSGGASFVRRLGEVRDWQAAHRR